MEENFMLKKTQVFPVHAVMFTIVLLITNCPDPSSPVSTDPPGPTVTAITVSAAGGVTEVSPGDTLQFSKQVTVTNGASQDVTWSVAGKDKDGDPVALAGTTIDPTGLLAVGANETAADLVVTAASTVTGFTDISGDAQVFVRKYEDLYLIGDEFGGWTKPEIGNQKGTLMTYTARGIYTWTGVMNGDKTFKFHDGTANDWNSGNWFTAAGDGIEPSGTKTVLHSTASGDNNSWKTPQIGTYTITLDTTELEASFSREALGAAGITLSIVDEGEGLSLTGIGDGLVMYKTGTPGSLTFTVTTSGYEYTWYLDGIQKGTGGSITLNAAGYNIGGYSVLLTAKNTGNNIFWSAPEIKFTVGAAPSGD
jgi:hypothetical protein